MRLRDKVAEYINKASNIELWQDVRKKYFEYSYLAFISICAHELKPECKASEVRKIILDNEIVEEQIVSYILGVPRAIEFVAEILEFANENKISDINSLYQGYISRDFVLIDGAVVFEDGKNSRDILGSYYTQEEFANEITRKAIHDYFLNGKKDNNTCIKIVDYSCGGGAFLMSACKLCREENIAVEIYGYDVDPVAVMITRFRLTRETYVDMKKVKVSLGNPLIRLESGNDIIDKFKLAEIGRFYSSGMGIIAENDIDITVGNPPWEKVRLEEKKFLKHYVSSEELTTKAEREHYLRKISDDNRMFYKMLCSDYEAAKQKIKKDTWFLKSSCGELNTYALFTELCRNSLRINGVMGLIIKSSLVKMPVYSEFFRNMTKQGELYDIYMFVNRKKIFNIDSREEFSVIYLKKGNKGNLQLALNLDSYEKFDGSSKIELSYDLLNKLNPDTGMIPNISNREELLFLTSVYEKQQTFGTIYPECRFGRLVHLTNHSEYIKKKEEEGYHPIYEGKFIEIYTGKYATFSGMNEKEKYKSKATARNIENIDGEEYPEARYYINQGIWKNLSKNFNDGYIIAWRSLTSATNRRTMLSTILPLVPTCQSIQILQLSKSEMLHVLAVFNSIVFDYIVRLKMAGLDLTQTIVKQIPVPDEKCYSKEISFMGKKASIEKHINSRIKNLYRSDKRVGEMFADVEIYDLKEENRKQTIAEIDILVSMAYGIDRNTLKSIALSFKKYYTEKEVEKWF